MILSDYTQQISTIFKGLEGIAGEVAELASAGCATMDNARFCALMSSHEQLTRRAEELTQSMLRELSTVL